MGSALQAYFAWHTSRNSGSSHPQRLSSRERSGNEKVDAHCFPAGSCGWPTWSGGPHNRADQTTAAERMTPASADWSTSGLWRSCGVTQQSLLAIQTTSGTFEVQVKLPPGGGTSLLGDALGEVSHRDHPHNGVSIHHRQMPEPAEEHLIQCLGHRGVGPDRYRISGHPLGDR
jgi:hypothetical protein